MQPSFKAFTLMEIVIVLAIMGIITLMTMGLSGTQLQNLQQKTIKEKILSTYQTHYSRNLTSSFFAGLRYEKMYLTLEEGENVLTFGFTETDTEGTNSNILSEKITFRERFVIENIFTDPYIVNDPTNLKPKGKITITYTPYQISCMIGEDPEEDIEDVVIITRIRGMNNYCFAINAKSCRMREVKCREWWLKEQNPALRSL